MKYVIMFRHLDEGNLFWNEAASEWVGPFDKSKTLYDSPPETFQATEVVAWGISPELGAAMEDAKLCMGRGDNELAAFMLRDYAEMDTLGLRDLAWELASPRTGYTAKQDVEFLLDKIEEAFA